MRSMVTLDCQAADQMLFDFVAFRPTLKLYTVPGNQRYCIPYQSSLSTWSISVSSREHRRGCGRCQPSAYLSILVPISTQELGTMNRQIGEITRRCTRLRDMRGLGLIFAGAVIYIVLFVSCGGSRSQRPDIFPRKIWQLWRADALSFEERDSTRARSWLTKNPTFRYEVLTDGNGLSYVQGVFGADGLNRPDIIETYKALNAKIIQADLLRYIVMYAEGGIYADVDVEALKSFDDFIPSRYAEQDISMLIGVETDEPSYKDHPILGSKSQSFCQWVFVCKPRQPAMLQLIDNIIIWLHELALKQQKDISSLTLTFDEVLSGTGPSAFTAAILASMSTSTGRNIKWDDFHGLKESKVVGNTLVLPAEAFAAGTMHSSSGNHHGAGALVKHHFHASKWTSSHPRYKHPVYGEIEKCNWDRDCVELWDANTAFFDALSPEDQMKLISMKEAKEKKLSGAVDATPNARPGLQPLLQGTDDQAALLDSGSSLPELEAIIPKPEAPVAEPEAATPEPISPDVVPQRPTTENEQPSLKQISEQDTDLQQLFEASFEQADLEVVPDVK